VEVELARPNTLEIELARWLHWLAKLELARSAAQARGEALAHSSGNAGCDKLKLARSAR
jgi:hypothetical protein